MVILVVSLKGQVVQCCVAERHAVPKGGEQGAASTCSFLLFKCHEAGKAAHCPLQQ